MIEKIKNLFGYSRTFGAQRSPKWGEVERQYLKENPVCIVCGTNKNLNIHHLRPVHLFPKLELDYTNLCTLCRTDHYLFGHLNNWSSYNPVALNDAKIWNNKIKTRI